MGDHIRRHRLDLGLTQRTLAKRWRVTEETVGGWERGVTQPLVGHLADILCFLGHDPYQPPGSLPGRLLAVRRRLGLTQAELAARLGQDEHQICRWERGRRRPHAWIANRMDLALRVLEGRPAEMSHSSSYFDLTRWRRKPPVGLTTEPETFGERLRARRLQLGLSMVQLAREVGISRGSIYRLERGKQRPSELLRNRLAQVLAAGL